MNLKHAGLVAAIAVLSVPAFAQVSSSTGVGVTSGTGTSVSSGTSMTTVTTTGPATASVTVVPSTSVAVESTRLIPGGVMLPATSTTVLGGPAANMAGSQTVMTTYWVNVPPNAIHRADFQRWLQLKP